MKLIKKKTWPLDKCYSIAQLEYKNKSHIVVASEKKNACLLFDLEGNLEDTIWTEPGGTMSIVPLAGLDGAFLATQKMYSPNDSAEAEIVLVAPDKDGKWNVKHFLSIPFVHRFDVLESQGKSYLLACTIKSGHSFKDDWTSPGQLIAYELPKDLTNSTAIAALKPRIIKDGLLKNHGYCKCSGKNGTYGVVSAQNGVYTVVPPSSENADWTVKMICPDAISDIAFADFDGDGQDEMLAISPFHGDRIHIYKHDGNQYKCIFTNPASTEFAHSIWAGSLYGKNVGIVGHRQGASRDLYAICYTDGTYQLHMLEKDCGSTNVYRYQHKGKECMVSTNREINEIGFYEFEE